ncbi:uncharacterized protein LOC120184804 [Hibiscus syriacus]|uniref:uncharacterized protein LOC120184804 n=1 Tax=Hibiscus syriacus TaxID=106335 RepID=UPI001922045C|nr:uncharacterized protein LOC120184804 [Hibiscus syriacus]
MVNILMWNCQGAAKPLFRRILKEMIHKHKQQAIAILETRISGEQADKTINNLGFENSFRVEAQGFSGGIWIRWKEDTEVEIFRVSNQFIHGNKDAWVLGGDFNRILRINKSFEDFVFDAGVQDVNFICPEFTWSRGNLYQRLDRFLINEGWSKLYPDSVTIYLDKIGSDHRPIYLQTKTQMTENKDRPFRFLAAWLEHPQFTEFLAENWDNNNDLLMNVEIFKKKLED